MPRTKSLVSSDRRFSVWFWIRHFSKVFIKHPHKFSKPNKSIAFVGQAKTKVSDSVFACVCVCVCVRCLCVGCLCLRVSTTCTKIKHRIKIILVIIVIRSTLYVYVGFARYVCLHSYTHWMEIILCDHCHLLYFVNLRWL